MSNQQYDGNPEELANRVNELLGPVEELRKLSQEELGRKVDQAIHQAVKELKAKKGSAAAS